MKKAQEKRLTEMAKTVENPAFKNLFKSTIRLLIGIKKETNQSDKSFYSYLKRSFKGKEAVKGHAIRYVYDGVPPPKSFIKKKKSTNKSK